MSNEHTYVKIAKDNNNYYKVIITKSYSGIFGNNTNVEELPFVFKSAEIAKDFVSILPDEIKKVSMNAYRCKHCHLCKASYNTYKLTIGDYEVYIRWERSSRKTGGFLSDKTSINTVDNLVRSFTLNIKPDSYSGYDIISEQCYEKLTDLINILNEDKRKSDSQKEEYVFELIQQ